MSDAVSAITEFFFDICGIFIPGFAFLAALSWMGFMPLDGPPTNGYEAVVVVLASYLVGHIIFSFAQRSVAWLADRQAVTRVTPKRRWLLESSPLGTEITNRLTKKWCVNPNCLSPEMIYEFCRNYIHIRDRERASFLRKEQTYGELSRSMVIVSVLCVPFLCASSKVIVTQQFGGSIVLITSAVLFFLRYLKARETDACLVYTNFFILLEEEEKEGAKVVALDPHNLGLKRTAGAGAAA